MVTVTELGTAKLLIAGDHSGMVSINANGGPGVFGPFGGYKKSGLGRELAMHGLELYTNVKNVSIDLND